MNDFHLKTWTKLTTTKFKIQISKHNIIIWLVQYLTPQNANSCYVQIQTKTRAKLFGAFWMILKCIDYRFIKYLHNCWWTRWWTQLDTLDMMCPQWMVNKFTPQRYCIEFDFALSGISQWTFHCVTGPSTLILWHRLKSVVCIIIIQNERSHVCESAFKPWCKYTVSLSLKWLKCWHTNVAMWDFARNYFK